MKKQLTNFLRIIAPLALAGLALWGLVSLGALHRRTCPELYAPGSDDYAWLYFVFLALFFLLMPLFSSIGGLLTGYRLHRLHTFFIEVRQEEKLRIRLSKRFGWGALLLPPRIDGTSPYKMALLSQPLALAALSALCLVLALIFWHTGPAQALLIVPVACLGLLVVLFLPRKNGTDLLSRLLAFRNSDKLRAWECALCVTASLNDGKKLSEMPDEWFQRYPAEAADDLYVSNCIVNGSSRLMRQSRFAEAYDMLQPLFGLAPSPDTHQTIACTLLNGAICEAIEGLPPVCLNQLEHPSVKYMTPAHWESRIRTAQYARVLFLNHDEAEATALLPQIEKDIAGDHTDAALIRRLQEKAGLITKEETT